MLVLSRKKGEVIKINDYIELHVINIKGDRVKIGVEAPKEVTVHREEVYNRIKKEKEQNA
jgi:carbon storage regulator